MNGGKEMQARRKYTHNICECGRISLGTLIVLAVLSTASYATFQLFTAYDAYWTFEKNVGTLVRFAFVNMQNDRQQQIVHRIDEMLDGMDVQYKQKDVNVTIDEGDKQISVDVWYSQLISLPFYPNPKHFHLHMQGPATVG